jgi:hypothetical protein
MEAAHKALKQPTIYFGGNPIQFSDWGEPAPREELDIEIGKIGRGVRIAYTRLAQTGTPVITFPKAFQTILLGDWP